MFGEESEEEREAVPEQPFGDDQESDQGSVEAEPEFDVTSGEDLVDALPSGDEIPGDVQRVFWSSFLLLKIAILALSIAAMLAYFRGQYQFAAGIAIVGLLAGGRAAIKVRAFRD